MHFITRYVSLVIFILIVYIYLNKLTKPNIKPSYRICEPRNYSEPDLYMKLLDKTKQEISLESWYALQKKPRDLPIFNQFHVIPALKNPCFWTYNCRQNYLHGIELPPCDPELRCLPYFSLIGTEKSGTTYMHQCLMIHQHVFGPSLKEAHFFNDRNISTSWTYQVHHGTVDGYTKMFDSSTAYKANGTSYIRNCLREGAPHVCPYILGDFTPRYLIYGYHWSEEWLNEGLTEPFALVPQKMRLMLPNIKLILMMRDPSQRFFSSYRYFRRMPGTDHKSVDDFHERAVGQIDSWNKCVAHFNESRPCLYGYPAGMLDFWKPKSADQIRIGLYGLYIKEWLKVFSQKQLLFINFDVFKKEPVTYIENYVLPFLGLEPFDGDKKELLAELNRRQEETGKHDGELEKMRDDTHKMLDEFYAPYNQELARLLGDSSYLWHLN